MSANSNLDTGGQQSGGQQPFDGGDNTLDSSQRGLASPPTGGQNQQGSIDSADGASSNLDLVSSGHQSASSTSLWAKVVIFVCLLVMLALIILTLICIRSGKKPKQTSQAPAAAVAAAARRASMLARPASHGQATAAAAATMQFQLAASQAIVGGKQAPVQQQASMLAGQSIYINGAAHKMFVGHNQAHNLQHLQQQPAHHHMAMNQQALQYGDAGATMNQSMMLAAAAAANSARSLVQVGSAYGPQVADMVGQLGKSSSLGNGGGLEQRQHADGHHPVALSSISMIDSYSRLSIDSDAERSQAAAAAASSKTIRHNPNGLVTFVSPAQQQQQQMGRNSQQKQQLTGAASQHQVSPQSISTSLSLSSSSSPSSSSSAHHTTATRLSTTDSASSSSNSNNSNNYHGPTVAQQQQQYANPTIQQSQQQPQLSPPSLPANPPPPHRLQQHHKQLMKHHNSGHPMDQSSQHAAAAANSHYMEPAI